MYRYSSSGSTQAVCSFFFFFFFFFFVLKRVNFTKTLDYELNIKLSQILARTCKYMR